MNMNTEFSQLFKLGRAERLQLVKDLWDSIVQEEEADLPIPDWKRDELRRRKERFLKPHSGRTWDQVKQRARSQTNWRWQ